MYHYTYVLLDPESDMKYIGMRSSKCKPEEDTYMGSSYSMTIEDKRRCDKLVLEEFATREEALLHEIKLHEQFQVHTNPEFWNLAKQTSTKFISNRKGCKLTEEHKRKCSEALKGRKMPEFTEEHRRKIAEARRGTKASKDTKKKLSDMRKGVNNSNFKYKDYYIWVHKDGRQLTKRVLDMVAEGHMPKSPSKAYEAVKGTRNLAYGWKVIGKVKIKTEYHQTV